jgi:hypothetical protein
MYMELEYTEETNCKAVAKRKNLLDTTVYASNLKKNDDRL